MWRGVGGQIVFALSFPRYDAKKEKSLSGNRKKIEKLLYLITSLRFNNTPITMFLIKVV